MNVFASIFLVFALLLNGPHQALPGQSDEISSIASQLQLIMKEHGVPGLSCAVVNHGKMVFSAGYGFADLENDVAATEATVYRLASISKSVTAVLIMQLVEQGNLDLDADVSTILKEWPRKRWPVTCRQLLAHLGGVRHYKPRDGESTRRYPNQIAALGRFSREPLLHEPGSKFLYSTFGFNLLAAVVERGFGQDFGKAVAKHVGMESRAPTLQDDDQRRLIKWRATGYIKRQNSLQNSVLMDSSYKLGGGGLCSSAPDLARFAGALMAGRLLTSESMQEMWTEQATRTGKPVGYGFGFGVRTIHGRRVVQHSGAQSRVSTMLCMIPDDQVAVVIMCNLQGTPLSRLAQDIAFLVREGQK